VLLPNSHVTQTRGIVVKIPLQQARPSLATQDSIKQDRPWNIIQGMMARSNPLLITRRHHGSKDLVHSGSMGILTTISSSSMRRSPVTSRGTHVLLCMGLPRPYVGLPWSIHEPSLATSHGLGSNSQPRLY
jgi:hypothetical protein